MSLVGNSGVSTENLKKYLKLTIVVLILFTIIVLGLTVMVYYTNLKTWKVNKDKIKVENIPENLFVFEEDDKIYISIKEFAGQVGYNVFNGGYKDYSENKDECYVENDFEVAEFKLGSNDINKYEINKNDSKKTTEITNYEHFVIEQPIKKINDELYASVEGIEKGFNVRIRYSKDKNQIDIYSLEMMVSNAETVFNEKTLSAAYKEEKKNTFNIKKAALYNLIVVRDTAGRYGVFDINKKEIIGTKYSGIEFLESSMDFIVVTEEGKMGIISYDGTTKIRPEYETLKQINTELGLYMVIISGKKGVIDKDGKILIYPENDEIGIEDISMYPDVKNQYFLLDKYIPVCKDKKWGWYDINGKKIVAPKYDSLGTVNKYKSEITGYPVLTISEGEHQLVIVEQGEKYGIIHADTGKEFIKPIIDRIYSTIDAGKRKYYMVYKDQVREIQEAIGG